MSKSNRNSGKPWTPKDISNLKSLANKNTPTSALSYKFIRL